MQKNNISYLLTDVRRPTKKKRLKTHNISAVREPRTSARRFAVIIGVFLLSLGSITAWEVKDNAVGTVLTAYRSFISAAESAKQYDTDAMGRSLKKADASLKSMNIYARILGIIPAFKEMPTFVGALQEFSKTAFFVTKTTDTLKKEGISLMWNDGGKLISELEEIRARVRTMTDSLAKVRNGMASFGLATDMSTDYLTLYSKMTETADILDGAINLLKGESNLVMFFMNDSEMRATGGFIGSYATVKLSGGEVKDIAVNDIYYPDKFLEEKVIPPTPLMGITTDWEARDANWFLDFPTSVSKVLGFLEKSPVYADGGTKFDGAVAINHKLVTDILKITGPIELPDYGIVLDNSNFLEEVQKEVSRDSTIRGGERKNILKSLLPELISRVQKLSSSDKEELARVLEGRLNNKDVQAYFVDKRLQNFVSKSLWAGEVYQPADSEYGDYLAVSVSNIGGEKTDAYIRQKVSLKSVISISGTVSDTLSVTRIHEGDKASEAFYKARNQAYIKVLTPQGAKLTKTAGETAKTIRPAVNYASKGYETDKDVALYESGVESGKAVFGRWLTVSAGSDKELTMEYEHIGTLSNRFRFVYEKQSGVDSMFSYSIQAPPGYVFKETGTSTYEYESANLPTRLIIDLTLSRL
ncbi:MAG: DUF4012 domain-containing protein [Parcubacteria group bacterium]